MQDVASLVVQRVKGFSDVIVESLTRHWGATVRWNVSRSFFLRRNLPLFARMLLTSVRISFLHVTIFSLDVAINAVHYLLHVRGRFLSQGFVEMPNSESILKCPDEHFLMWVGIFNSLIEMGHLFSKRFELCLTHFEQTCSGHLVVFVS